MPEKEPIKTCAEFKPLRNAVVTLASDITALPEMKESGYHYSYAPREFSPAEIAEAKKLLREDRYDEAWKLLVSESTNGNSYAYAFLGDCLCSGRYWYADRDRGMWFLTSAADKGNSYAMYRLELENLKDDKDEAEYWFKKAAEHGVVNAMYSLYRLYKDGDVMPSSSADKLHYLRKSAEAGFKAAEYEYSKYLKPNSQQNKKPCKLNVYKAFMVGVTGFEPAASWSRTKRSTELSHTPMPILFLCTAHPGFVPCYYTKPCLVCQGFCLKFQRILAVYSNYFSEHIAFRANSGYNCTIMPNG